MRELNGKVAVVTGGASGIGRAMVDRFLTEGMQVVVADVEAAALDAAMAELRDHGDRVRAVVTDVSDEASVEALARAAVDTFGTVHLLCNNAGVSTFGRSWKFRSRDWAWVLGVNLWGVIHGIRTFLPILLDQGEGHVVNTSSMVGVSTQGGLAPYSVSTAGVVALSEALDLELRDLGTEVGVSVLLPGFVRTRIGESERNRPEADRRTAIGATVSGLLDVGSQPAEVADQVVRAVQEGRFWIVTHPELLVGVELRTASILEGRRPEAIDLDALLASRADSA